MIITIGSHKGGTGKSTLSTNLAAAYQAQGQRVIVIEAETPQCPRPPPGQHAVKNTTS